MAKMAESLVLASVLVGAIVGSTVTQRPASAQTASAESCPTMIKHVRDRIGNRFDAAHHKAMDLTREAEELEKNNKSTECIAKVKEAATVAGVSATK